MKRECCVTRVDGDGTMPVSTVFARCVCGNY